jgi:hypothetical protein
MARIGSWIWLPYKLCCNAHLLLLGVRSIYRRLQTCYRLEDQLGIVDHAERDPLYQLLGTVTTPVLPGQGEPLHIVKELNNQLTNTRNHSLLHFLSLVHCARQRAFNLKKYYYVLYIYKHSFFRYLQQKGWS